MNSGKEIEKEFKKTSFFFFKPSKRRWSLLCSSKKCADKEMKKKVLFLSH
jgi:hypothetical protein